MMSIERPDSPLSWPKRNQLWRALNRPKSAGPSQLASRRV
jgi:hypothetical protein